MKTAVAMIASQVSLIAVILAVGIGVPIGLMSGYFRGFLDDYVIIALRMP